MCGIFGAVNGADVVERLVTGLRRLEYRGYDSAGIATIVERRIGLRRAVGKLENLETLLVDQPLTGRLGIAHTRWATHGKPTAGNAHPHVFEGVAVVHNGVIENYRTLRRGLEAVGHGFVSDTDSEVVPHLVAEALARVGDPLAAARRAVEQLTGSYALALLFDGEDDLLIATRRGSPLAIAQLSGGCYLSSDALAFGTADSVLHLEDGEWAVLRRSGAHVEDARGRCISRPSIAVAADSDDGGKGAYAHYMAKEIAEQPDVIRRIGETPGTTGVDPNAVPLPHHVRLLGCGSSHFAALVGRHWIEELAAIPATAEIASEYRYRRPAHREGDVTILVSQSGETADTLAAAHVVPAGQRRIAVVNQTRSGLAALADEVRPTACGPEIAVASTKAFVAQLAVLTRYAVETAARRGVLSAVARQEIIEAFDALPDAIAAILAQQDRIARHAATIAQARHVVFLGRGPLYPVALEGALKLKEITYIPAEGLAAGEMKHGPIAMIDAGTPVIGLLPSGPLSGKTMSSLEEAAARGAQILAVADRAMQQQCPELEFLLEMPALHPVIAPIAYAVPLQILAYHTACALGLDVDRPRNLAKSVTVE